MIKTDREEIEPLSEKDCRPSEKRSEGQYMAAVFCVIDAVFSTRDAPVVGETRSGILRLPLCYPTRTVVSDNTHQYGGHMAHGLEWRVRVEQHLNKAAAYFEGPTVG